MSKLLAALLLVASVSAFAEDSTYISPTLDFKDKVNSPANHEVAGLSVGHNFGTWTVEGRMEDERVSGNSGSHEGLAQVKVDKDIGTWYGITPYAGVAVGEKSKSSSNFAYYVVEVGAKYAVTPSITLIAQSRERTPFNEGFDLHQGYGYHTVENKIGVKYAINKNNVVGLNYAVERGDSSYDTTSVTYAYKF